VLFGYGNGLASASNLGNILAVRLVRGGQL
jgi:hypothetical protein